VTTAAHILLSVLAAVLALPAASRPMQVLPAEKSISVVTSLQPARANRTRKRTQPLEHSTSRRTRGVSPSFKTKLQCRYFRTLIIRQLPDRGRTVSAEVAWPCERAY
jgi:hypothetical protein